MVARVGRRLLKKDRAAADDPPYTETGLVKSFFVALVGGLAGQGERGTNICRPLKDFVGYRGTCYPERGGGAADGDEGGLADIQ